MDKELEVRIRALVSGAKDVERLSREVQDLGKQQVPDTTGRFRQGLDRTGQALRNTRIDVLSLQGAIAGLGLAAALREIVRASDDMAKVRGQLRLVTESAAELASTESQLKDIADQTRSDVVSTAELYARVAQNTRELNLSQQTLMTLTKGVNQAFQISGASAEESAAGVRQLTQALARGVLRGDEFISVAESAPRVLTVLEDALGATRGELIEMAHEGQLTADIVIDAFRDQSDALEREFNLLPRRVSQALTQLRNDIREALGRSNVDPLIDGIDDLREILTDPETIQGITTFANAIVTMFGWAAQAIATTTNTVQFLADALASQAAGPAIGDIPRIEDAIEKEKKLIEQLKTRGDLEQQLSSGLASGYVGRDVGGDDTASRDKKLAEARKRLSDYEERLRLSREMAAQLANKPSVDTDDEQGNKPITRGGGGGEEKRAQAIQDVLDKLREQRDTYGQTAEQAAIYKLETLGASEAQIQQARAIAAGLEDLRSEEELHKRLAEIERERARQKADNLASDRELQQSLEEEIELMGLGARERAQEIASRRLSADATAAQRDAVRELAGELYDAQERARDAENGMSEFAREAARSIQGALADGIFDSFDDGLDGMVVNFATALKRMAAEAAAANIAELLFGGGGSASNSKGGGLVQLGASALTAWLTGGSSAGASASGGASQGNLIASLFHTGGIAGGPAPTRSVPIGLYGTAERYHSGGFAGFKPGEVPAILQREEEVLTTDDPRHRKNLRSGTGGGDSYQINVPVTVEGGQSQGTPEQAQQLSKSLERAVRNTVKEEIARAQMPRGALKK